ncbi:MAG: HlyD family secretion protein [Bacteroides sp.]|nr:HlyD family secretion protein [Bacteroides sp.]
MEEIYKPDAEDTEKVEIYSRENNDMLGDMPEWLIHTGSYIVYGLIVLLIAGTALFKYPDTIKKSITIDDMGNVEWITANHTGMIDRFFIENQSQVKQNDTLGILKNTASLRDVKRFCRVLSNIEWYYRTNDISYLQDYPFDLIMGEMSGAYEQFTQAVRTCSMYQEFDLYPQKKRYLDEELKILNSTGKTDALAILNVKRELFELEINHKMETGKNRRMLELAYENMVNSLKTWDNKYLIKSRHDGIVVWGKSWGMSNRVNEGDTLCTVISKQKGNPLGHIKLSQDEVAEIAVGDKVNIELNKYPTHSYGILPGRVASISFIPYNKSYAVEVDFPEGLVTTSKKEIKYEIDMSGKAEIITSSRSILSRIFAPIYELFREK